MKSKATIATLASIFLLMAAPAQADVIADQSRIWAPSPQGVGLETVALPVRGTITQQ
jgi:hypothetical protein